MKEQIKVFANPLLNRLTQTSLALVIIVYVPIFMIMLYGTLEVNFIYAIPLFLLGILGWTITEYLIHRFIFHSIYFQTKFTRFYLIIHGIHHETPLDKNRLVVPLYVSLPLSAIIYFGYRYFMGAYADPLFAGFILGYLDYDITHYRIHHFQPKTALGKKLRTYHFAHHFKDNRFNFGVSSPLWDGVFASKIQN